MCVLECTLIFLIYVFFLIRIMDNIFGKEDSGDESEHNDIEDKDDKNSPSQNLGSKDTEVMDVDNTQVKV